MFITRRLCLRSGRILSIVAAAITIVSMSSALLFIYEQMKGTFGMSIYVVSTRSSDPHHQGGIKKHHHVTL